MPPSSGLSNPKKSAAPEVRTRKPKSLTCVTQTYFQRGYSLLLNPEDESIEILRRAIYQ